MAEIVNVYVFLGVLVTLLLVLVLLPQPIVTITRHEKWSSGADSLPTGQWWRL